MNQGSLLHKPFPCFVYQTKDDVFGSLRSSRNANVRLSGEKCFRAHNIHLSLSGQSQVSLRSVSGVCLCAYFVSQTEPKILRLVIISSFSISKNNTYLLHLLSENQSRGRIVRVSV